MLSLKAGGTGLNLTAASHVVLYDRWWNPAVEDQARDRAWRIGQTRTVVSHRLVCPGTVDERVEEVVAGKRHIADLVLPKSSLAGRPRRRPAAGRPRPAHRRPADRGRRMTAPTGGDAAPRKKANQKRRRAKKSKGFDVWRAAPPLPDPAPIVPVHDPTALLRSLGDPPLQGQTAVAQHYLGAVVERAAGLATALAAAANLLADPSDLD